VGGSDKCDLATVEAVSARGKSGQRRPKRNGRIVDPNVSLSTPDGYENQDRSEEDKHENGESASEPRVAEPLIDQYVVAIPEESNGNRNRNDRHNPNIEATRPKGHGPA